MCSGLRTWYTRFLLTPSHTFTRPSHPPVANVPYLIKQRQGKEGERERGRERERERARERARERERDRHTQTQTHTQSMKQLFTRTAEISTVPSPNPCC